MYPVEDPVVATSQGVCFSQRIVPTWRRQDGRQPRGLVGRQVKR